MISDCGLRILVLTIRNLKSEIKNFLLPPHEEPLDLPVNDVLRVADRLLAGVVGVADQLLQVIDVKQIDVL